MESSVERANGGNPFVLAMRELSSLIFSVMISLTPASLRSILSLVYSVPLTAVSPASARSCLSNGSSMKSLFFSLVTGQRSLTKPVHIS